MRACILVLLFAMATGCFSGCGQRNSPQTLTDAEYQAASGGAATVGEVSDAIRPDKPNEAAILDAAKGNIDNGLQTDKAKQEKPEIVGTPLTTAQEIKSDPITSAQQAASLADERNKGSEESRKSGILSSILEWGGWASLGGIALWAARMFNVPGVQLLTDPLVKKVGGKWLNPVMEREQDFKDQIKHLTSTIESSMVGRAGLQQLDALLPDEVIETISMMTGGKASNIDELFKWAAASHVRDSSEHNSLEVAKIVDMIKDSMPTLKGRHAHIESLLTHVSTDAQAS